MTSVSLSAAVTEHLVVRIDGQHYGIPMSEVRELSSARMPTLVPGLPDYIRGVVLFDDQPMPIVDAGRFMKGPLLEFSPRSCLVFVGDEGAGASAGILVDDLVGVVSAVVETDPSVAQSLLLTSSYVLHEGRRIAVMRPQGLLGERGQVHDWLPDQAEGKSE